MSMTLRSTLCAVFALACSAPVPSDSAALPHWTFSPEMIFPADQSLTHAEDGVVLADGRLIVGDQFSGLRLVGPDGTGQPFGDFAGAGYEHSPPEFVGGPNGVTLEPAGTHILVSDVFRGGLYRVEIATEATELIYQHPYGINTARADSAGGIWFSQSTENHPENGEAELFQAIVDMPADGGLFYMPPPKAGGARTAIQVVEALQFANGVALDETGGYLYLAETLASRVWRFRFDMATGRLSDRTVALEVDHPDNLELDGQGRLWIVCPIRTEVVVFEPETKTVESVIRISTPESEARIEQIQARIEEGTGWLDLMGPALWEPGPGLLTGLILSPDDGPVYLTGLGKALVKLER